MINSFSLLFHQHVNASGNLSCRGIGLWLSILVGLSSSDSRGTRVFLSGRFVLCSHARCVVWSVVCCTSINSQLRLPPHTTGSSEPVSTAAACGAPAAPGASAGEPSRPADSSDSAAASAWPEDGQCSSGLTTSMLRYLGLDLRVQLIWVHWHCSLTNCPNLF